MSEITAEMRALLSQALGEARTDAITDGRYALTRLDETLSGWINAATIKAQESERLTEAKALLNAAEA